MGSVPDMECCIRYPHYLEQVLQKSGVATEATPTNDFALRVLTMPHAELACLSRAQALS